MPRMVPEPNAELLSADEVQQDVASLTTALARRRAERRAYDLLARHEVRKLLDKLIQSGACASEEEAIERALRTLVTAVTH